MVRIQNTHNHGGNILVGALIFMTLAIGALLFVSDNRNSPKTESDFSNSNLNLAGIPGEESVLRVPLPPLPEVPEEAPSIASGEESGQKSGAAREDESSSDTAFTRELIGVEKVTDAVLDPETSCSGDFFDQLKCYGNYLTKEVQSRGVEAAIIDIKERYNGGNSFVHAQCHQLMHVVGRASTQLYPTVGEAYNHGDGFCWSGYYHGIMEAILAQLGVDGVKKNLDTICADFPGKATYSFNYFNCVHGLGHGIMFIENHELFEALKTCDALSGRWEQESCYGGAFMENVIANEVDHFTRYLKDDDPFYPCNAVGDTYKNTCYLMQTSRMLDMYGQNFIKVFELCGEVEEKYKDTCYQSLGRDASGRGVSDITRTHAACMLGPDFRAQKNCVVGAVKDFISFYHSDEEALALCRRFDDDSRDLGDICRSTADIYYLSFNR